MWNHATSLAFFLHVRWPCCQRYCGSSCTTYLIPQIYNLILWDIYTSHLYTPPRGLCRTVDLYPMCSSKLNFTHILWTTKWYTLSLLLDGDTHPISFSNQNAGRMAESTCRLIYHIKSFTLRAHTLHNKPTTPLPYLQYQLRVFPSIPLPSHLASSSSVTRHPISIHH